MASDFQIIDEVKSATPFPPSQNSLGWIRKAARDDIDMLYRLGFHMRTIAQMLDIAADDVRLVCPQSAKRRLSRRAFNVLMNGRHAAVGGWTAQSKAKSLATIAAAYTVEELGAEPGVGSVVLSEIELWLEEQGMQFRDCS